MFLDSNLFLFLNSLTQKWLFLDWLIIFLAQYLPYLMVLGVIIILLQTKDWNKKFYFFALNSLSLIISRGIVTEIIRFIYSRPRPYISLAIEPLIKGQESGSLPSGHAAAFIVFVFAIYYFYKDYPEEKNKNWFYFFLIGAILMGLARVAARIHWPLDIVSGALIAWGSVFVARKILKSSYNKKSIAES